MGKIKCSLKDIHFVDMIVY